jgi:hypothetical protein
VDVFRRGEPAVRPYNSQHASPATHRFSLATRHAFVGHKFRNKFSAQILLLSLRDGAGVTASLNDKGGDGQGWRHHPRPDDLTTCYDLS